MSTWLIGSIIHRNTHTHTHTHTRARARTHVIFIVCIISHSCHHQYCISFFIFQFFHFSLFFFYIIFFFLLLSHYLTCVHYYIHIQFCNLFCNAIDALGDIPERTIWAYKWRFWFWFSCYKLNFFFSNNSLVHF